MTERAESDVGAPSRRPFTLVVHQGSPLAEARMLLEDLLRGGRQSLICVSGLAGVGKTALAMDAFDRARAAFGLTVRIEGRDRAINLAALMDLLYIELPIERTQAASLTELADGARTFLRATRTLVLLDNGDDATSDVLRFCAQDLAPSQIVVTVRDASPVRTLCPTLVEVEHPGLTADEMDELFAQLMDSNPLLMKKATIASPDAIAGLLSALQGWPQALILAAARLSTTQDHISDLVGTPTSQESLYSELLDDVYKSLGPSGRALMSTASAFPVSITADGIHATTRLSKRTIGEELSRCVGLRLLDEVQEGVYVFSHPVIRSYSDARRHRLRSRKSIQVHARDHLLAVASRHGGQPDERWSNFSTIDRESDNLHELVTRLVDERNDDLVTELFRSLFSYFVERGHWVYVEEICRRMVSMRPKTTLLADWLVWSSWLAFYLRSDFDRSLTLAADALDLEGCTRSQRFEAHRRAVVASGQLSRQDEVERHYAAAAALLEHPDATRDQEIDLANSYGSALSAFMRPGDQTIASRAMDQFRLAEELVLEDGTRNTRELGVAYLGQSSIRLFGGEDDEALAIASQASDIATSVNWLRGMAEAADLLAEINRRRGDDGAADIASRRGADLRRRLRESPRAR